MIIVPTKVVEYAVTYVNNLNHNLITYVNNLNYNLTELKRNNSKAAVPGCFLE